MFFRSIATSVLTMVMVSTASADVQDEIGCEQALFAAAGKYQACSAKVAAARYYPSRHLKCRQRYNEAWVKLTARYPTSVSCGESRFIDNGTTVTDNLTRLEWEKKTSTPGSGFNFSDRHDVDNRYAWSATSTNADGPAFTDFLDYLNSTGFAGHHDWRLPTLFELQTILSTDEIPCASPPCVADAAFLPDASSVYWSASTLAIQPTTAWITYTHYGSTWSDFKLDTFHVRAVRGGL